MLSVEQRTMEQQPQHLPNAGFLELYPEHLQQAPVGDAAPETFHSDIPNRISYANRMIADLTADLIMTEAKFLLESREAHKRLQSIIEGFHTNWSANWRALTTSYKTKVANIAAAYLNEYADLQQERAELDRRLQELVVHEESLRAREAALEAKRKAEDNPAGSEPPQKAPRTSD